jgi:serine/threonine protein kinase
VKTLKFNADATVLNNQEVQSLIRLNNENNPNLIRLLVTFQHKAQLHLVFPWADGNLQDFWKIAYPDPNIPIRDVSLARWVIEQCLGLALGLKAIHHNCVDKSQAEEQGLPFDAPQKKHGRHGDFKPENILWFKQNGKSTPDSVTGTFKISDFGFADFHASMSASNIPTSDIPGMTPTYRAPEWNVKKSVASSYDIWSFGCVLLEFVEWYLRGWQGVEDFSGKRALDSVTEIPGYTEDNFFNLTYSGEKTTTASAKESVHVEIDALRRDDNSSDFILDLLDYIEDRILRMRPEQRADCDSVVEKLEGIYRRCSVDAQYCTERRQCIREKRMTGLSELAPSPKFVSMGFSAIPLAHARSASLASETASSSHLSAAFVRTEGIPSTQYKADGGSLPPTDPAESRLHTGTVDLDEASSADAQPELAMSQLMGLGIDQVYSRHLNNTVQLSTENVARYLEVPSTGANQSEPSDKTSKRNSTIINDKSYKTTPAVSDKNVLEGRHSSKAENSEPAQEERRSGSQRNRNTASTNRRPQKRKSQWLQTKSHMIFERVFPCLKP